MCARKVVEGATYDPRTLKIVCRAFDQSWASIADQYTRPLAIQSARLRLASCVLAAARLQSTDVDALRAASLKLMATDHRTPPPTRRSRFPIDRRGYSPRWPPAAA